MKKIRIIKVLLVLAGVFLISGFAFAQAPGMPGLATPNLPNAFGSGTSQPTMGTSFTTELCTKLFEGDPTNIFKEVLCSLTRTASMTTADLAMNTTCTILGVGASSNYLGSVKFKSPDGKSCISEGGIGAGTQTFGVNNSLDRTADTGIYKDGSQLTIDLVATSGSSGSSGYVKQAFDISRALVAIFAFIALMFFAFANIAHYEINTYAIKKALPVIIVALVGGALSLSVVGIISKSVDLTYRMKFFDPINSVSPAPMHNIFSNITKKDATGAKEVIFEAEPIQTNNGGSYLDNSVKLVYNIGGKLLGSEDVDSNRPTFTAGIFGTILLVIPALAVIILQYVLALRPFAIQLLTIVGPLAFASLALPQTQILFRKWWAYLLIAFSYAPIVNFVFYFMNKIDLSGTSNPVSFIAVWAFKIAIVGLLIRFPFTVETDIKKATAVIAKSRLGETLGLNKIFGGALTRGVGGQTKADTVNLNSSNANLGNKGLSGAAQRLIASVSPQKRMQIQSAANDRTGTIRANRLITKNALPNLGEVFSNANKANLARPSNILLNSAQDLNPDTFKAVVNQSDMRLWHDTRLIEQLKNKNGQVLDNEGAALRADSARKTLRLAQVMDKGMLQNPDAIKVLAQKGALDNLPLSIVKEAIAQGILQKQDLKPTYQNDTDKMFDRLQKMERGHLNPNNQIQVKALMNRDQKDYSTGYKDLEQAFAQSVKGIAISPQSSGSVTKEIVSGMRNNDGRIFEKNGDYFLNRLSQEKSDAKSSIANTMQTNGVSPQIAKAISGNSQIDFAQALRYMKGGASAESVGMLKQGFASRDLSGSLINEVSKIVREERTATSSGITKKIADSFKIDDSMNLNQIRSSMSQLVRQMSSPMAPREAQAAIEQVNKFHPSPVLNTTGTFSDNDISKARDNAEAVSSTVSDLIKSGLSRETIKNEPKIAQDSIASLINDHVKESSQIEIRSDGVAKLDIDKTKLSDKKQAFANTNQAMPQDDTVGNVMNKVGGQRAEPSGESDSVLSTSMSKGLEQDNEFNAKLKMETAESKNEKQSDFKNNSLDNNKSDTGNIVDVAIKDMAGEKND